MKTTIIKLKSTNSREIKLAVYQHILDAVDIEDNDAPTIREKIEHIRKRYASEYSHLPLSQDNMQTWLQGLALNVEYMNHAAVELVCQWNGCNVEELTDKQYDAIVNNWWSVLSAKTMQLLRLDDKNAIIKELSA